MQHISKIMLMAVAILVIGVSHASTQIDTGLTLEAGYLHVEKLIDGDRKTARFNTPLTLGVSPDKKHVLIFDANGYRLRTLNAKGDIRTSAIRINGHEKFKAKTFKTGSFLITDPVKNLLIQVTPDFQPFLFAGQYKSAQESDAELMDKAAGNSPIQILQQPLSEVVLDIPIDIQPVAGGWLYKDGMFKNHFKYIGKDKVVTYVKGLAWLTEKDSIKGFSVSGDYVYAYSMNAIYKLEFNAKTKTAKKVAEWNNDTAVQFHEIRGLVVDNNSVLVIDSEAGALLSLGANNTTKVLYQSPCNSPMLEKNDYKCEPVFAKNKQRLPVKIGFSGIVKNPWSKGYLLSDRYNHVLYQFVDNQLSLYAGKISPAAVMTDTEQNKLIGSCEELVIKGTNKYCLSSLVSYMLNKNNTVTPFAADISFIKGAALHDKTVYSIEFDSILKTNLATQKSSYWGAKNDAGFKDGDISKAQFSSPSDIIFAGNHFYIADHENRRIRKLSLNGKVSTFYQFPPPPAVKIDDDCSQCDLKYKGTPSFIISNGKAIRVIDYADFVYDVDIKNTTKQKITPLFRAKHDGSFDAAALDSSNNIWVIANHENIFLITPAGKRVPVLINRKHLFLNDDNVQMEGITQRALPLLRSLAFDAKGNLWIGSDTGLLKLQAETIRSYLAGLNL